MSCDTCGFCGNPTPNAPDGWCDECQAAPKCDHCGDPCPDGYFDKENSTCEFCTEKAQRAQREAARREFEMRGMRGDYLRDLAKDERGLR